jgi:hypothetical protein
MKNNIKTYTHWEVLVKCEHCNKDNLAGHHDHYYCGIDRRNQLIESFGNKRVKIIKIVKEIK